MQTARPTEKVSNKILYIEPYYVSNIPEGKRERKRHIMKKVSAIILAAGKGKRMKSALPKVAHAALGRPLVWHVAFAAKKAGINDMVFVLGFGRDKVLPTVENFGGRVAIQESQFGTGDAARCGLKELPKDAKEVVVLCGDAPLLRPSTIRSLVAVRRRKGAAASVLTGILQDPAGYGRIVRDPGGNVAKIVEEKDADDAIRQIREVNSGTYAFDRDFLEAGLPRLSDVNAQREFYLTDIVLEALSMGERVVPHTLDDPDEVRGINSRRELAEVSRILRLRKLEELMDAGVTIVDPDLTIVDFESRIGTDSIIEPSVMIAGKSRIGRGVLVQTGCIVRDSVLEDGVILKPYSIVESSKVKKGAITGPFVHLRPKTNNV